ncbi:MAG TPA: hypothetical protein VFG04_08175 [Planctomycetaceae bacterium]|jgi:hypothetical protein|nr:hypothetical protein [Planctomycetaceae bacterium]
METLAPGKTRKVQPPHNPKTTSGSHSRQPNSDPIVDCPPTDEAFGLVEVVGASLAIVPEKQLVPIPMNWLARRDIYYRWVIATIVAIVALFACEKLAAPRLLFFISGAALVLTLATTLVSLTAGMLYSLNKTHSRRSSRTIARQKTSL